MERRRKEVQTVIGVPSNGGMEVMKREEPAIVDLVITQLGRTNEICWFSVSCMPNLASSPKNLQPLNIKCTCVALPTEDRRATVPSMPDSVSSTHCREKLFRTGSLAGTAQN